MTKYLIGAAVLIAAYFAYKSRQTPYAGYVSSGWGAGGAGGNMPGLYNTAAVVGQSQPLNVPAGPAATSNAGMGVLP